MSSLKKNRIPDHLNTLIGSKTIFEGVLTSNESICIEGTVKGKVECKGSVMVGEEGKVKADIIAENALIGGQVNSSIKIRNKLEITSTGRVIGNIETSSLVIALKGLSLKEAAFKRVLIAVAVPRITTGGL